MKKVILALLTLCAVFAVGFSIPLAAGNGSSDAVKLVSVDKPFDSALSAYGTVRYSRGVEIDGAVYPLCPEFDSQSDALNALKEQEADALAFVGEKYGLAALSNANYAEYQNAAWMEFESAEGELSDSLSRIDEFFDLYENRRQNDKVVRLVKCYHLPWADRKGLLDSIRKELPA